MAKRKREHEDGDDVGAGDSAAPNFRRQRQIMAAYVQGSQLLEKAFKLARGFERQKLGRRKKNALAVAKVRKGGPEVKGDEVARIDAEVAALKTLDMARSAQNFLAKSLLKIKAVQEAPDLPVDISTPKSVSSDTATLNVHARLCNSNPVKAALPAAAAAPKAEFGIAGDGRNEHAVKKPSVPSVDLAKEDDSDSSDNNDHNEENNDQEDEEKADSSDVDVEDLERQLEREGVTRSKQLKDHVPKKLFLPSLSMAGYVSGSGSDLDDDEFQDAKPAKNRRGQRARQAIWEKKYGKRAKHVQEQEAKQGWDAKRGAVLPSKYAKDANAAPLGKQRAAFKTTKSVEVSKNPTRDDTGPLHPSWEAKKLAKEKKVQLKIDIARPTGKKISFD